jgi:hypothetical protein
VYRKTIVFFGFIHCQTFLIYLGYIQFEKRLFHRLMQQIVETFPTVLKDIIKDLKINLLLTISSYVIEINYYLSVL